MIVGAYFKDGTVAVLPLEELAARMGVTPNIIKQTMDGKHRIPGVILSKLPNGTTQRNPPGDLKRRLK